MNTVEDLITNPVFLTSVSMIALLIAGVWLLFQKSYRAPTVELVFTIVHQDQGNDEITAATIEEAANEYLTSYYHGPQYDRRESVMYDSDNRIVGFFITDIWGALTFKKLRRYT